MTPGEIAHRSDGAMTDYAVEVATIPSRKSRGTTMKAPARHLRSFLLLLLALSFLCGCHDNTVTSPNQIIGSGRIISREQQFQPFTGIQLTGIGSVYITQDTTQTFRLEADDNIIDRVTTTVSNQVLIIGLQPGSYSSVTINVFVSMKSVELLELSGSGTFATTEPVQASTLTCRIQGAGSMTLRGSAADQIIEIQGVGDIHSFDLAASRCSVLISGTGSAEVTATQRLEASISGVGSVIYAGNPQELIQRISGVGTIQRRH
jgi:hypothetical protein